MENLLTKPERKELIYRLELQSELQKRYHSNRIKWFTPNGKQNEFIKAVASKDNFVIVLSSANGVGKTALMANILGGFIFGDCENPYLDYSIFKDFPYPKRARIASTSKNVEEIGAVQTEIKTWWPKGKYTTHKRGRTYDCEYVAGEWVVDIMTYEQKVREYESATLGVMIFDEPPPLDILNACIARMRQGGVILIFMTPLDTGGEILEDLQEKKTIEIDGKEIGKVKILYAEIEDNCKQHGVRGQLEHEHIQQMIKFYDADEIDARAKGKPTHMIGRIYPTFTNDEPFVVEDRDIPKGWARVQVVDPHDAIPFAVTWAAIDFQGEVWIYDEYPFEDLEKIKTTRLTLIDYSRIFREREGRNKPLLRLIDPYFANIAHAKDGLTLKQDLADIGFDYEDGSTAGVELGHKRVREFLRYDKEKKISALNHSRIHILRKCRNHWRSMLRYKRKFQKSGEVKDKLVLDETYKHFCDNIRHLLMRDDLKTLSQKSQIKVFDNLSGGGRGGW